MFQPARPTAIVGAVLFAFFLVVPVHASEMSAEEYYERAVRAVEDEQFGNAVALVRRAVELSPNKQRYRELLERVRPLAADQEIRNAKSTPPTALLDRIRHLEQALSYYPESGEAESLISETRFTMESAKRTAREAKRLASAGRLDEAESVLLAVKPFEKDISEIASTAAFLRGRKDLASLPPASTAVQFKENAQRLAEIAPLVPGDPELMVQMRLFGERYQDFIRVQLAAREQPIPELIEIVKSARELEEALPEPSVLLPARTILEAQTVGRIETLISMHEGAHSPHSSYLAANLANHVASTYPLAAKSTQRHPPALLGVVLRSSADPECLNTGHFRAAVFPLLQDLPGITFVDDSKVSLAGVPDNPPEGIVTIRLTDPRCTVSTQERLNLEDVTSSYVLTHVQENNPQYVRLQTELANAQAELDRQLLNYYAQVDPWARLGASFSVGHARREVNRIGGLLNSTSPYLSKPVYAPYAYQRFESRRSVRISARILGSFQGNDRLLVDRTVTADAESLDTGVRGTMTGDRDGATDKEPILRSDGTLRAEASDKFTNALREAVGRAVLEFASERFAEHVRKGNAIAALASGVQVKDIAGKVGGSTPTTNEAEDFAEKFLFYSPDELRQISAQDLRNRLVRIDQSRAGVTRKAEGGSRVKGGMQDVLERVLRAVVVIETETRIGSGFLLSPDGLIVTNEHVVAGSRQIVVRRSESEKYLAKVLSADRDIDLAILRIPLKSGDYLQLSQGLPRVGTEVWTVGSPLGLFENTVTHGIVSAVRRDGDTTWIQIDAPINPGNSGGPLIDGSGRVLGVSTWKQVGMEGVGFALAADEVRKVLPAGVH